MLSVLPLARFMWRTSKLKLIWRVVGLTWCRRCFAFAPGARMCKESLVSLDLAALSIRSSVLVWWSIVHLLLAARVIVVVHQSELSGKSIEALQRGLYHHRPLRTWAVYTAFAVTSEQPPIIEDLEVP